MIYLGRISYFKTFYTNAHFIANGYIAIELFDFEIPINFLLLTFEAPTAPAGQKVAAKCAEAIRHCAPAGQTTDRVTVQ